jgi:hypothetical protein
MRIKQQLIYTVTVWTTLGIFLVVLNPAKLPVIMLILPFILLFTALYSLWRLVQQFILRYSSGGFGRRRLGLGVSGTAVLLLALQSLGQLTLRDVVTLAAIMVLGYLYLGRTSLGLAHR